MNWLKSPDDNWRETCWQLQLDSLDFFDIQIINLYSFSSVDEAKGTQIKDVW